jgi:hypothetical protein
MARKRIGKHHDIRKTISISQERFLKQLKNIRVPKITCFPVIVANKKG